jgi:ribosome recycling factor
MPVEDILFDAEERMEKAVEVLVKELRTIRTGRASSSLVEFIKVDYYGTPTPLRDIAQIGTPDPKLIVIKPFDPSAIKEIMKAIQASELGITPQSDAKLVRLTIPPLSTERRQQLSHHVKHLAEETKIAVRNVRRDANKQTETEEKDSVVTEDDAFKAKEEINELTKKYEKDIDDHVAKKVEEIMTV